MKELLQKTVLTALRAMREEGVLPADALGNVQITRTRDKSHGDFACNVAMSLAKPAGRAPRELAQVIIEHLPANEQIDKVEVAGPGFINFYLRAGAAFDVIDAVLEQGAAFGRSQQSTGRKVQVEFVSTNPTGPLHVGHGRGAAYGACVANLLAATGHDVQCEYYVNDAGRQMDILATSSWLRYLELTGEKFTFPSNGYRGDYMQEIAEALYRDHGNAWKIDAGKIFGGVPADEPEGGDKEAHIDGLIGQARVLLGDDYRKIFDATLNTILGDIRADLEEFGVGFDNWFSEQSLMDSGELEAAIEKLRSSNHIYEKEGALWFRSTDLGDEKDRVVVRANGQTTYFASDIAYHANKLDRGFDHIIDVWGADHHGYIPRVSAALEALAYDPERFEVLLVQFASLYRNGEKVQMSTRSGSFVTLRELRAEAGNDAARFFYVMRKSEQHLDFDLDLAKSRTAENPVFYIQYAHARVCSVLREMEEQSISHDRKAGSEDVSLLSEDHEQALITSLWRYPEVVETAANAREPHQLAHFLRDLANAFHTYYNAHKFLVEDEKLRNARLNLILAAKQVIANGLSLLGVSAPESM